jgi:hypothetical protein
MMTYSKFDLLGFEARIYEPTKRTIVIGDRDPWYVVFPHMVFIRVPNIKGKFVLATVFATGPETSHPSFFRVPLLNINDHMVCLAEGAAHYAFSSHLDKLIEKFWSSRFTGVTVLGWRYQSTPEEVIHMLECNNRYNSHGPFNASDIVRCIQKGAETYVW